MKRKERRQLKGKRLKQLANKIDTYQKVYLALSNKIDKEESRLKIKGLEMQISQVKDKLDQLVELESIVKNIHPKDYFSIFGIYTLNEKTLDKIKDPKYKRKIKLLLVLNRL